MVKIIEGRVVCNICEYCYYMVNEDGEEVMYCIKHKNDVSEKEMKLCTSYKDV